MSRLTRSPRARAATLATASLALVSVAAFACSESTAPEESGTFFGPVTAMASGSGRAYVTLDAAGTPTELGIALTEGALVGLPDANTEFTFVLPARASATAYRHAVIDWGPNGHVPAGVYTVPHFDVHFYLITQAERDAIVLPDAAVSAKLARQPAAEFIPPGYVAGVPTARMGLHWRDPSGPEFNGQPFTTAVIYGTYDGAVTFIEPMVAKAYLETKPAAVVTPVNAPDAA